jgi:type I restriction enzyme S subunit
MSSEWHELPLGELVTFKTGKLDSNAAEESGRFPFFTCSPNTLAINSYAFDTEAVILAGNNANGVFSTKHYSGKFNAYQRTYVIEPIDIETTNCRYVYFLISHMVGHLKELSVGSATKFLTKTILNALTVRMPPKLEQDTIANLLLAIDDRITLLRETNATLEAIAQALFKSWFVDFDPVRAKMEGRIPEGMDEDTARLFPDALEESELGLVPRGWVTSPIYDMATFINGAAYKAFQPNAICNGRPIIKIAELKSGVTSQTAYSDVAMPEKYLIETGDILFSWSGNPDTSIDTFVWTYEPAWLNQHIFRVLPREPQERTFLLQILRHLKPVFTELARNKQTTGLGHVTVADMKRELIAMPTAELLLQFDLSVGPIHARIFENQTQAQTLATLRDTLLPRLISGQLRLPDAEAVLENA